jgi:hypothetical protein
MKTKAIRFSLGVLWITCLFTITVFATDLFSGRWTVNVAKSTFNPGPGLKAQTVLFEATGADGMRVIIDSTGADGKTVHSEWVGKFDGKDYPMKGDPNIDTRSFRKIDDYTLEIIAKKTGKVITTTKTVYNKDGKTRISTQTGTNAQGQSVQNTIFSEKQ